jgi:Zn ribbon nucleic-acid-binding protein
MALKMNGKYQYGDSQSDIRDELRRFSVLNGYEAMHFADAVCACGQKIFQLEMDESEGVAVRLCMACGKTSSRSPWALRCTRQAKMCAGFTWDADVWHAG